MWGKIIQDKIYLLKTYDTQNHVLYLQICTSQKTTFIFYWHLMRIEFRCILTSKITVISLHFPDKPSKCKNSRIYIGHTSQLAPDITCQCWFFDDHKYQKLPCRKCYSICLQRWAETWKATREVNGTGSTFHFYYPPCVSFSSCFPFPTSIAALNCQMYWFKFYELDRPTKKFPGSLHDRSAPVWQCCYFLQL